MQINADRIALVIGRLIIEREAAQERLAEMEIRLNSMAHAMESNGAEEAPAKER